MTEFISSIPIPLLIIAIYLAVGFGVAYACIFVKNKSLQAESTSEFVLTMALWPLVPVIVIPEYLDKIIKDANPPE